MYDATEHGRGEILVFEYSEWTGREQEYTYHLQNFLMVLCEYLNSHNLKYIVVGCN